MMPPSKFPRHANQPSMTGVGKQFMSSYVENMGCKQEISRLWAKLNVLKKQTEGLINPLPLSVTSKHVQTPDSELPAIDGPAAFDKDILLGTGYVTSPQEDQHSLRCTVSNHKGLICKLDGFADMNCGSFIRVHLSVDWADSEKSV
ncbi:hypothetical protein C0995_012346 [Termitomyces sp. Mi166|nr:hypothetical protein C0995_012346 [Termitomyces sp. Mi166\